MKIAVAQLNYHVGNFDGNRDVICDAIRTARNSGAKLVIFSELCITGYPPLDLLDRADFIAKCRKTIGEIAGECKGITAIVGAPVINTNPEGKKLHNSALVLSEGKVIFQANKALLPTYDIFDEYRYFEPGNQFKVFETEGIKFAITICEDIWDEQQFDNELGKKKLYSVSPMDVLALQYPDFIINIAASPFSSSKPEIRENLFKNKAAKHGIPLISVNQTGGNTELIFDGASVIINGKGELWKRLQFFEQKIEIFETDDLISKTPEAQFSTPSKIELIHKGLVTGIRDYFRKTGFSKYLLGLSGGIDSAVTLALAAEALGPENGIALLMPSKYSSEHSVTDAVKLAKKLGVKHEIISIEKPFAAFEELLAPHFKGLKSDITEENMQARIRALILMAFSNKFGHLLLNTSNKSEAAVGYGTLYGDMAGGLSIIGDVYKTAVYELAGCINRKQEIIPVNTITKLPSAELKPGQYDSDSLPDYRVLDEILYRYIEQQKTEDTIISEGFSPEMVKRVVRLINYNEYKRYQAPPVLRVSSKSFGDGRRMPLAAKY